MNVESIKLRDALPQEIGEIALVVARAHAYRDGEPLPAAIDDNRITGLRGYLHEYMGKSDVWAYTAFSPQRIVGFASGYPGTSENAPAADTEYLSFMMVEPDYWGRGIASRLLDLVADRARHAGKNRVTLWTREEDNQHAREVYEHKGFVLTGIKRESKHGKQIEYELDL